MRHSRRETNEDRIPRGVAGTVAATLAALLSGIALAGTAPTLLSYQGTLTDASGEPITSPTTIRFTLLEGGGADELPSTGRPVYQEEASVTPDANGIFTHLIGGGAPTAGCDENGDGAADEACVLSASDFPAGDTALYLELRVDPDGPEDNTLLPRRRVVSTGYALNADNVSLDAAYDAGGSGEGATIDADSGPVQIKGDGGLDVESSLRLGTPESSAQLNISGEDPDINLDIASTSSASLLEVDFKVDGSPKAQLEYNQRDDRFKVGLTYGKNLAFTQDGVCAWCDDPEYAFDVSGDLRTRGNLVVEREGGALQLFNEGGNAGSLVPMIHLRNQKTQDDWVVRHNGESLHFQTETTPDERFIRMTLWKSGAESRLGVGTTEPGAGLHIAEGDLIVGGIEPHTRGAIRLQDAGDVFAHAVGTESYYTTFGPNAGYGNSIGHKFYTGNDELVARIGVGGGGLVPDRLDSEFYGNFKIQGDLNLGTGASGRWVESSHRLHLQAGEKLYLNPNGGTVYVGGGSSDGYLYVVGEASVETLEIRGGADLAEPFETSSSDEEASPGTVMVIDEEHPGRLRPSTTPYDTKVAGVVSGAGDIEPGVILQQERVVEGNVHVALTGRAWCRATTENGPIRPGDRLTTASVAGHAMRVLDGDLADGAVLGKAMSALEEGEGLVLVLVNLQ